MQTSSFFSLPTDIIFNLLVDFLEPRDALQMAAVCRELAAIISQRYYALAGLSNPQENCLIKSDCRGYMDDLTGPSLDLNLTSIQHFVFHSSNFLAEVNILTRNVDRLCNIFGRLSSIGSVCITFQSKGDYEWNIRSEPVQQFIFSLRQLLEIVIQKSCSSLHIQLSHPITTNYKFELVKEDNHNSPFRSVLTSAVSPSELIKGNGWKYFKLYEIPTRVVPPPKTSIFPLTHVDLFSGFLLIPPYSPWTFAVLKSSPITSLTLSLPRHVNADVFQHYIFPNLVQSLPLLQELKFTFHGSAALASVTENLPLFSHLRNLLLGHTYYGPFAEVHRSDSNGICNLISITGSLDQVVYLLRSLRFPKLKFINVLIEFRFRLEAHFVETGSQFSTIHRTLSEMDVNPRVSVRLLNQGSLLSEIPLQATKIHKRERTWLGQFRHVTHLYLEVAMSAQNTELLSKAEQVQYATQYTLPWLTIFTGVTNLKLISRQPFLDTSSESLRNRWTTFIGSAIDRKFSTIQSFDVLYITKNSLRHWTCDDEDWGIGDASISEKDVECHFKPEIYSRSLKPDWVMHDVKSED